MDATTTTRALLPIVLITVVLSAGTSMDADGQERQSDELESAGSNKSGPIDITADGTMVVAANTDTDTVTIFDVRQNGRLARLKELKVGDEPRSVATLLDKPLRVRRQQRERHRERRRPGRSRGRQDDRRRHRAAGDRRIAERPVRVRRERERQHRAGDRHREQPGHPGPSVSGAARVRSPSPTTATPTTVTSPSTWPTSSRGREQVSLPPSTANLGGADGAAAAFPAGATGQAVIGEGIFDDSREAVVDVVSTSSHTVVDEVVLGPLADTGFNFARGAFVNATPTDAPRTIFADGGTDGALAQATGAFPNMLQSIVVFGDRGFVPNSAASPEPPLRFNLNVQSLVSVFDLESNEEIADQTFNMNRGINFDLPAGLLDAQIRDNTERMFPSVPVDIDCSEATDRCWVVSQGSDFIVRMDFDAAGKPTINAPTAPGPFDVSPVVRIFTIDPANPTRSGRNPRGIVLNADGTRGYVVCPTTRDVIVADLVGNTVLQRIRSSDLPTDPLAAVDPARQDRLLHVAAVLVRPRLGRLRVVPSRRPHRQGDVVVRGRAATDDLARRHVRQPSRGSRMRTRSTGRRCATRTTTSSSTRAASSAAAGSSRPTRTSTQTASRPTPIRTCATSAPRAATASAQQTTSRTGSPSRCAAPSRRRARAATHRAAATSSDRPPPAGANCVACHSGEKWTTSRVTYDPVDVNPMPGVDTGIVNTPDPGSVFLNGFISAAGAGRLCEVPPPPGASKRLRIMHQVGTFAANNPIEVRHGALSPVNTVAPALAVANAFGGDGFSTPDAARRLRQRALLPPRRGPDARGSLRHRHRSELPGRRRGRTGAPARAARRTSSTAIRPRSPDLIAFLRTIDDRTTPFPAADLAPNDPTFADAAALCDCQKDPPLGTPALDCAP